LGDQDVQAIMDFFAGRAQRFAIPVAPTAQPESLEEMLGARGFDPAGYAWMKFRRGTDRPTNVATYLRIEEIGSEQAGDFGMVAAEAFELPSTSERASRRRTCGRTTKKGQTPRRGLTLSALR
jgi:hypothetical protein